MPDEWFVEQAIAMMGVFDRMKDFTIQDTLKAKCFAILLLVFHHMFNTTEKVAQNVNLRFLEVDCVVNAAVNARVCVWIFVFLSAYGMAISYKRGVAKWNSSGDLSGYRMRYFWHRILMLQKVYFPIVIIHCIRVLLTQPDSKLLDNPLIIVFNFLGLADVVGLPQLTGIFWYISFTMLMILFFPLFYDLCERYCYLTIPMVSVLTLGYIGTGIHSHNGGLYLQYVSAVFAGIIFAQKDVWIKVHRELSPTGSAIRFIVLLVCATVLPIIRNTSAITDVLMYKQVLMTGSAIAVCWIAYGYFKSQWISIPMIFIGKYSAYMYLLHLTIIDTMKSFVFWSHSILLSYVTCVAMSLLLSVVLSFILEHIGYNSMIKKLDGMILAKAR